MDMRAPLSGRGGIGSIRSAKVRGAAGAKRRRTVAGGDDAGAPYSVVTSNTTGVNAPGTTGARNSRLSEWLSLAQARLETLLEREII